MRSCNNCKSNKVECDENFRSRANGKFYSICRDCDRLKALEYAKSHREERKLYQKQFIIINPEYKKDWKSKNKSKIRQQERERRATDINFKIKKNVSRSIGHVIVKNGKSTFKYLPYTSQELRQHLENQFDDKMTWENYGTYWQIDHIIPHSLFKYLSMEDGAFQECWALNNLRPLEAHQNMMDGSTRIRHKK
jgi:hypothetical protein